MRSSVLHDPVLVLNKSWNPVDTCTVKKAFSRLFDDRARFMQTENDLFLLHDVMSWLELPVYPGMPAVSTSRFEIRAPEILVLTDSDHIQKRRTLQFSRRNLARRDRMTCQYCGCGPGTKALTIDHVVPKASGGRSVWDNCVLSCWECNSEKRNRTPDAANMQLRVRPEMKILHPNSPEKWRKPYAPAWSPVFRVSPAKAKESWKKFVDPKVLETMI